MGDEIRLGDLVMFVKSCCIKFRDGASIFEVGNITPHPPAYCCSYCHSILPRERYASESEMYPGAPISWLKKIPPLSELEDERVSDEQFVV